MQNMPFTAFFADMPQKAYHAAMRAIPLQTPAQLATHLRAFRKARGLTQAQLGELVGLDQTRIARIERDPRRVSMGQIMKLLAVLRVRVLLQPLSEPAAATPDRDEW